MLCADAAQHSLRAAAGAAAEQARLQLRADQPPPQPGCEAVGSREPSARPAAALKPRRRSLQRSSSLLPKLETVGPGGSPSAAQPQQWPGLEAPLAALEVPQERQVLLVALAPPAALHLLPALPRPLRRAPPAFQHQSARRYPPSVPQPAHYRQRLRPDLAPASYSCFAPKF